MAAAGRRLDRRRQRGWAKVPGTFAHPSAFSRGGVMHKLLVAILIVSAGVAVAQPPAGIVIGGGGGGVGCSDVARQIVSNWFDVRDSLTSDSSVKRPMPSD